jgi:lysophospholipid acyltransferase (LPLAT)-like uncharacterized protein
VTRQAAYARATAASTFRKRWSWRTTLWVSIVGWLIALALRLVYRTLRIRVMDEGGVLAAREQGTTIIATFWHDAIALMPLMVTRLAWPGQVRVMLSWHRDAEIAARAIGHLGIACVYGSSTRGWLGGVRGLLAASARGEDLAIAPDGPLGPRHEAKDGVVQLARATGRPMIAFGVAAWPARRLGSWDRMQLPRPFARVALVLSAPIPVGARGEDTAAPLATLEATLARVNAAAREAVGAPPP